MVSQWGGRTGLKRVRGARFYEVTSRPTDDTGEPSVERVDRSRERHARGRSSGGSGPCGRLSGADDEHPTGYGGTGLATRVRHTVHRCSARLPHIFTTGHYNGLSTWLGFFQSSGTSSNLTTRYCEPLDPGHCVWSAGKNLRDSAGFQPTRVEQLRERDCIVSPAMPRYEGSMLGSVSPGAAAYPLP